MKFDAKMAPKEPLPAGSYPFEVLSAEDTQSKNGNDMITVKLQVMGPDYDVYVTDWLLPKVLHRLIHFCETTGMEQEMLAGEITAAGCKGKSGMVILEIEQKSGFSDKNKVKDYEGKPAGERVIPRKSEYTALKPDVPNPKAYPIKPEIIASIKAYKAPNKVAKPAPVTTPDDDSTPF